VRCAAFRRAMPRRGLTTARAREYHGPSLGLRRPRDARMPKPRYYIRHVCRTFYLSEWWDE